MGFPPALGAIRTSQACPPTGTGAPTLLPLQGLLPNPGCPLCSRVQPVWPHGLVGFLLFPWGREHAGLTTCRLQHLLCVRGLSQGQAFSRPHAPGSPSLPLQRGREEAFSTES